MNERVEISPYVCNDCKGLRFKSISEYAEHLIKHSEYESQIKAVHQQIRPKGFFNTFVSKWKKKEDTKMEQTMSNEDKVKMMEAEIASLKAQANQLSQIVVQANGNKSLPFRNRQPSAFVQPEATTKLRLIITAEAMDCSEIFALIQNNPEFFHLEDVQPVRNK